MGIQSRRPERRSYLVRDEVIAGSHPPVAQVLADRRERLRFKIGGYTRGTTDTAQRSTTMKVDSERFACSAQPRRSRAQVTGKRRLVRCVPRPRRPSARARPRSAVRGRTSDTIATIPGRLPPPRPTLAIRAGQLAFPLQVRLPPGARAGSTPAGALRAGGSRTTRQMLCTSADCSTFRLSRLVGSRRCQVS